MSVVEKGYKIAKWKINAILVFYFLFFLSLLALVYISIYY